MKNAASLLGVWVGYVLLLSLVATLTGMRADLSGARAIAFSAFVAVAFGVIVTLAYNNLYRRRLSLGKFDRDEWLAVAIKWSTAWIAIIALARLLG